MIGDLLEALGDMATSFHQPKQSRWLTWGYRALAALFVFAAILVAVVVIAQ